MRDHIWALKQEINIIMQIDHPCVIKFYEIMEDPWDIHIVMEYCAGGNLMDMLLKINNFWEDDAVIIFRKIVAAVNHLHKNNIVHRDIKPENILFLRKLSSFDDCEIKLVDFGLSKK